MIWAPFVLAVVLGSIVAAALYFAYMWPRVEPEPTPDDRGPPPPPDPAP